MAKRAVFCIYFHMYLKKNYSYPDQTHRIDSSYRSTNFKSKVYIFDMSNFSLIAKISYF